MLLITQRICSNFHQKHINIILGVILMKEVIFSRHSISRMFERDINEETVKWVISKPDYSLCRFEDEIEAFKKIGDKTLKVVYVEKESIIKVITLHWMD